MRHIRVGTLPVAKRWLERFRSEASQAPCAQGKIGIWEIALQGKRAKSYQYSSDVNYIVGSSNSTHNISHLGKRIV